MRISDWSSDVCSSDLAGSLEEGDRRAVVHLEEYVKIREIIPGGRHAVIEDRAHEFHAHDARIEIGGGLHVMRHPSRVVEHQRCQFSGGDIRHKALRSFKTIWRSEEHTSELQSLMRKSYAVFCLKKKKKLT